MPRPTFRIQFQSRSIDSGRVKDRHGKEISPKPFLIQLDRAPQLDLKVKLRGRVCIPVRVNWWDGSHPSVGTVYGDTEEVRELAGKKKKMVN